MVVNGLLSGWNPASDVGMGTTYSTWLEDQFGYNPAATRYGQTMAPWAQLQYLSNPAARMRNETGNISGGFSPWSAAGSDVANPFMSYLGGANQGYSPLTSGDWMQRAMDVQAALGGPAADVQGLESMGEIPLDILQQRFGGTGTAAGAASAEQADARQRALAFAPVMTGVSQALRGEIGNVLNRMFNRWQIGQPAGGGGGSFLDYAMGVGATPADEGLWAKFGLQTPAQARVGQTQSD